MNRKTILPLAAALLAALPLPAAAFEAPRGHVLFQLVDDDDDDRRGGHWQRIDGRWVPLWAVHGDRWDDDDDDRWDDDQDDDEWDDDDDDDDDNDDD